MAQGVFLLGHDRVKRPATEALSSAISVLIENALYEKDMRQDSEALENVMVQLRRSLWVNVFDQKDMDVPLLMKSAQNDMQTAIVDQEGHRQTIPSERNVEMGPQG